MTTLFLNIVYTFLNFIISSLPSGAGFPSGWHTAVSSLGGYLHILDPLVPISILLTCLGVIFGVEIAIFGWKTFKSLFSHVPFVGGKGH